MKRFLKNNSLSTTMFGLFLIFLAAQSEVGHLAYNQEQREHHEHPITYVDYVLSGNFMESVFENWESEFLQMGSYVLLTIFLFQKGSPESKKIGEEEPQDKDPRFVPDKSHAPWPVRRGGWILKLYENSLTIALFGFFVLSLFAHAIGGVRDFNQGQVAHGGHGVSLWRFMRSSEFWFQSFQNWQSEFLAVGALTVFAIFLRQRGSPESKPVAAPHSETGN